MPREVELTHLSQPRGHLLHRPKCAILIAAIVGEWTTTENRMAHLYATALGTSSTLTDEEGDYLHTDYDLAALLAMRQLSSSPNRIDLVNKKIIPRLTPNLATRWQLLVPRIEACAKERNTIAHGDWWLSDKHPDNLILQNKRFQLFLYEASCFEGILERIVKLSSTIDNLAFEVGEAQSIDHGECRNI